jgi:uncharacterized protein YigE (DUF2233 family)
MKKSYLFITLIIISIIITLELCIKSDNDGKVIISNYIVNPKLNRINFYHVDGKGKIIKSILDVKNEVEKMNKELIFAMNGGMYMNCNIPMGLLICENKIYKPINRLIPKVEANFYLQPNGVFYITKDNIANVCSTKDYKYTNVKNATQSGPMLLIEGKINPIFKINSKNLNIRNGVGILPNNNIVFAISENEINFYDFANYFKKLGCKNALFLDGYVSRAYIPSKKIFQTDGDFGVIIGVTKP